jgi:hypothetical protein
MKERLVATGLCALPFLYVAALVLSLVPLVDFGVYLAFGLALAITALLGWGTPAAQLSAVALDVVLAVLVGGALAAYAWDGAFAGELTAGVLVGLPFLVSAMSWRPASGLAHRSVALGVAVVLGTGLLAAREAVLGLTTSPTPTAIVQAFFPANAAQLSGLAAVAGGLPEPSLPLRAAFDPVFVALGALAAGGIVLLALRPRSGSEEPLPVAPLLPGPARANADRLIPFSDAQLRTFGERSTVEPPTGAWPPGLASVFLAAVATTGFLAAVFAVPLYASLGLVLALVGLLLALGAVTLRSVEYRFRPTK